MMNIEEYMEEMKKNQVKLLNYLESDEEDAIFNDMFQDNKNHDNNNYYVISILYLISKISNDHHRNEDFFSKIFQVLQFFKDMISKISNSKIFHIFKNNKRILLFLIEEGLLIIDEQIVRIITSSKYLSKKYPQYFQPEIRSFISEKWFPKYNKDDPELQNNEWVEEIKKELPDDFYEKRKIGENDSLICKLIQKDSIDDFIIYVNQSLISLDSTIQPSNYETNNFLIKNKNITLIEYSAFFDSIRIFKYLMINNVELTPSLWLYAIHGHSTEIISLLEDKNILSKDSSFIECFKESIKCHHIDIATYIYQNFSLEQKIKKGIFGTIDSIIFHYRNYFFFPDQIEQKPIFFYACKYDYLVIVKYFLNNKKIDINETTVENYDEIIIINKFLYHTNSPCD